MQVDLLQLSGDHKRLSTMSKNILLTFVFLAVSATLSCGFNIKPMVKIDEIDTLLKSANATQKNPEQNTSCFNTYTPQLAKLADTYQTQHGRCVKTANTGMEAIIKEVAGNVASITKWHNEICNGYSNCQGSEPYPFFQCNNKAASEAVTTSFSIQTMSKDRMEYVKLRTELVDYDVDTCFDKSSQTYTVASKGVYDQLQDCLNPDETKFVS